MVPVCDAKVRPISKQASNERRAKRDKAQIKASILRIEIRELRCRLYCDINQYQQIIDDISKKEMITWKTGQQQVIQAEWAQSDRQFGRDETLRSASVATDRAGNEKGVNVCKRARFISRGFMTNMPPK